MRARAIRDLGQLAEPEFFERTAVGLRLIVKNVERLWDGAAALRKVRQTHAAHVLAMVAEEEAAKALILIDAVRCPRQPHKRFSRQLGYFNSHLAKGIYARAYGTKPTTLAQLQEYVDMERETLYLDGPNDDDWIFRCNVIEERESRLYVDYVAHDEGHRWSDPSGLEIGHLVPKPHTVKTALHFHDTGLLTAEALAVIADLWRITQIEPGTHCSELIHTNWSTLERLKSSGLLQEQPSSAYSWIIQEWQYPMYDLDLSAILVKHEALRERQRNRSPERY